VTNAEYDRLSQAERMALCEEALREGVTEAIGCEEGCQVEPDGTCPHDGRSILLVEGRI
jgi:hypothetical protein